MEPLISKKMEQIYCVFGSKLSSIKSGCVPIFSENLFGGNLAIVSVSFSGIEASKEEELDYVVPKEAFTDEDNAVFRCKRHTAFNGLHYMICKIKAEGNITKNKYFSLYVNDNDLSKSYLKKAELE
ncbi:hypothetical protein [Enterococcus faecalis]|uniref:hypothetical protein n=1 Tax=Enterococcus faecalis TaxID=1351 RepID=UPI00232F10EE|nr:hypothetical protein [Enterococcus faecalis]MDB1662434.1 hypothetical protein [Enterococcus faecalis]